MEELLLLCTKGVPFSFDGKMYAQVEGVMMGSPLGALFANIFMSELENKLIPKLKGKLRNWTRYVDDTFAFIKPNTEKEIIKVLNSFHKNIKFTYENENMNSIAFLDVKVSKAESNRLETSVYRKSTNTDIYINWYAHAPTAWKVSTLKCLIKRAIMICSTETALQNELTHIKFVFTTYNQYPPKLINEIISKEIKATRSTLTDNEKKTEKDESQIITLSLPYVGDKGVNIVTKMKKNISSAIKESKEKVDIRVTYKAKKLGAQFSVKDKEKVQHLQNIVYHAKCPNKKCTSHYVGQTKCRLGKRATEHNRTNKTSHVLIHSKTTRHRRVWLKDYKVLGKGYGSTFKRRISESLFVKKLTPDLNVQKDAYKLNPI